MKPDNPTDITNEAGSDAKLLVPNNPEQAVAYLGALRYGYTDHLSLIADAEHHGGGILQRIRSEAAAIGGKTAAADYEADPLFHKRGLRTSNAYAPNDILENNRPLFDALRAVSGEAYMSAYNAMIDTLANAKVTGE